MLFKNLGNYKLFLLSNSVLAFALGIFSPFYIIFIQDFGGGINQFGFAIGLMIISGAVASYYSDKYSDKLGRKKFLIASGFLLTLFIFSYTMITSILQLYILQILNGAANSIQQTIEVTFLGDVTKKSNRGINIGKYHAIVGVVAGLAMMGGGVAIGEFGFKIIFYVVSIIVLISTLILFSIRE